MIETIKQIGEIIVIVLILLGVFLNIVTAIGLVRLPDLYTRTHAASKSSTLGILLILLGVFLHFWIKTEEMNGRLLLGIIFVFITGPVAGHLIGRAAYNIGIPLWKNSVVDELHDKKKTETSS